MCKHYDKKDKGSTYAGKEIWSPGNEAAYLRLVDNQPSVSQQPLLSKPFSKVSQDKTFTHIPENLKLVATLKKLTKNEPIFPKDWHV